jgi:hypothetical protein
MSNIGPLTTTFTAPSDCDYISVELVGSPTPTSTTYYNYVGKVWPSPLRCFPSGYPNAYSDRFSNYYSPGICPSGWTEYPTSDYPDPAETTALCCPPGFITTGDNPDVFASSFPCFTTHIATTPATAVVISGSIDIATKPYGDNPSGLITSTDFVMQQIGYSVFGMQVRYRSADFLPHNSSSATSSSIVQVNSISNTQANSQNAIQTSLSTAGTTQSSVTANTNNGDSALSNGAKIGIGIGVPLVVILLGIIVAFVLIRRRRQRTSQQAPTNENTPKDTSGYDEHKAELPGNMPGTSGGERYIGKAELDDTVKSSELEDTNNDWPLPSHSGINVTNTDVDTISSVHGTTHSDMASGAVSPPETSRSCVPVEESVADAGAAEEQVKYRYIGEEPKVKKQSSRGEF